MPLSFRYSILGTHFTRSCDVIDYVTNRFAIGQFLAVVHWTDPLSLDVLRYLHLNITGSRSWHFEVTWCYRSRQIMGPKHFEVTTLTFVGHVTSSVTWPLDSPHPISYSCPIVTEPLSLALFEILGPKYNWVTTLTFLGHVTSSVTWPLDSPYTISYSCPIVTKPLSLALFEILRPKDNWVTTLTFLGHVTSSVTWPLDSPYPISYSCPIVTKPLSPALFDIFDPKVPCAHTDTRKDTRRKWFCPMQGIALDRQWMSALASDGQRQTVSALRHSFISQSHLLCCCALPSVTDCRNQNC